MIEHLEITNIRNLKPVSLEPSVINLIYGDNGSGKTSLLEAIHLLSVARSFRSKQIKPVVQTGQNDCILFATLASAIGAAGKRLGLQRSKPGELVMKVDGEPVKTVSDLAIHLPVQVINSDTFQLLDGSPDDRRRFLDWGLFHVEPQFYEAWKKARKLLKQRNSLLRRGKIDAAQMATWNQGLADAAEALDALRDQYFNELAAEFNQLLPTLLEIDELSMAYYRGWDKDTPLLEVLETNFEKEAERGYTQSGPHRADIRLRYQGQYAADMLSRGQQKLVVCALKLAQGRVLARRNVGEAPKTSIYLVDDLPAELDQQHRQVFCQLLESLGAQVFITCIEVDSMMKSCWQRPEQVKMFHVEQGVIQEAAL